MKLRTREEIVIRLLREGDEITAKAFEKMLRRFDEDDEMFGTFHGKLIRSLYITDPEKHIWKIAVENNASDRSLYRYRKEYLGWIDFYRRKLAPHPEAAAPSGN